MLRKFRLCGLFAALSLGIIGCSRQQETQATSESATSRNAATAVYGSRYADTDASRVTIDLSGSERLFAGNSFGGSEVKRSHLREARPGELLVKFKSTSSRNSMLSTLNRKNVRSTRAFRILPTMQHVRLADGASVDEAIAYYKSQPNVEYVEPNYVLHKNAIPNDPNFPRQWALHNIGQNGAVTGADIDAPAAWDIATGGNSVVIAVIDSGIDYNHEDLSANVFRNTADCNNNGVDDDGNGYVDDCFGIDIVNKDSDPFDDEGHGTHVAGVIGAVGNNGVGVTGVAWNVKLLPCKFLDATGNGSVSGAIECLDYIAGMKDRGVNIVATNNSYGSYDYSQALYDAIVVQRQKGILFITAAGNDRNNNDTIPQYPCSYYIANIVCVGSFNGIGIPSFSTNSGSYSVHLNAPGEGGGIADDILSTLPSNSYGTAAGTSIAAGFVSGAAALLAAQNPARDWIAIRNILLSSGYLSGYDFSTISRRQLNVGNALNCSDRPLKSRIRPAFDTYYRDEVHRAGVPVEIAVLNINCENAVGSVVANIAPSGESITLLDNGQGADQVAGDGIYSATWTPLVSGSYIVSVPGAVNESFWLVVDSQLKPGFPQYKNSSPGSYKLPLYTMLADIGGDENLEIIATGIAAGPLYVWQYDGTLLPGWPRLTANGNAYEGHGAAYPAAGHLNGANPAKLDLFSAFYDGTFALYTSDGQNRPGWPVHQYFNALGSIPVIVDLDNDGIDEIIAPYGDLRVYRPDGRPHPTLDTNNFRQERVQPTVADLDGDGKLDLITRDSLTGAIYAQRGDGSSLPGFPVPGENIVGAMMVGDINADGDNDIVFAGPFGITKVSNTGKASEIVPRISDMGQSFVPFTGGAALGDLDNDGVPEIIVVAASTNPSLVRVYAWHGDGSLLPGFPVQMDTPPGAVLGVDQWQAPVVGDLDGDGFADIAFTASTGNTPDGRVFVVNHRGQQLSGYPKALTLNGGPILSIGDIDRNGFNDLVVAGWSKVWVFEAPGPVVNGPVEWGQYRGGANHLGYYELGKNLKAEAFLAAHVRGDGRIGASIGPIDCPTVCIGKYAKGTRVTLTASSANGSIFEGWSGACAGQSNTCTVSVANYTTVVAQFRMRQLTVAVGGSAPGSVVSAPSGISCPVICSAAFAADSTVTLTAVPNQSAQFNGWSGACGGMQLTCTVVMGAEKSVTANFIAKPELLITLGGNRNGSVTSSPAGIDCGNDCSEYFETGTEVTLAVTPTQGNYFNWRNSECTGAVCVIRMDAAKVLAIDFTPTPHVIVSTSAGGLVSVVPGNTCTGSGCDLPVSPGAIITLTAAPDPGFRFAGWTGGCAGSASTCLLTMNESKMVVATFASLPVLVVAVAGTGTGTVTSAPGIQCGMSCNEYYSPGTSVTLTALARADSTFQSWSGACSGAGASCTVTMDVSKSVTANFALKSLLTVIKSGGGTDSTVVSSPAGIQCGGNCSMYFDSNAVVVLTATASSASTFVGWSGACSGVGSCTVTMSAALSVTAIFDFKQMLTVTRSGAGTGRVTSAPAGIDCGDDCTELFGRNAVVALSATPSSGSVFGGWSGACSAQGSCTVTMTAARQVVANFAPAPVAPSSGGGGGGSIDFNLLTLFVSLLLLRHSMRKYRYRLN